MEGMPFYYRMIRGAIGKDLVIKHYKRGNKKGKIIVTRFPDMSGIVATERQKVRRDLFKEAVVFAKWIIADEERKLAFRNTLPRKKRRKVYQAALQMYMKEKGNKLWVSKVLAVMAVVESGRGETMRGKGLYGKILWEAGTDIRYIQAFLGHNNLKTTMRYTQVSRIKMESIGSLLDKLPW